MSITVLPTPRSRHCLLFEAIRAQLARLTFAARRPASLDGLDERTLRDIGFGAGEIASMHAVWHSSSELTRLRIMAGQGHV